MIVILSGAALAEELTAVRESSTPMPTFRAAVRRIGLHLAAEASKYLPTKEIEVNTPLEKTIGHKLDGHVVIVPVLRAGLGLYESFLDVLPNASVGFEGMKRDEATLTPKEYYRNFPNPNAESSYIVIDPMLATGGSMSATIKKIRERPHKTIIAACLIAAPDGINRIANEHPNVTLIVGAQDRGLNEHGFIVPGLGDAGDRLFGTE